MHGGFSEGEIEIKSQQSLNVNWFGFVINVSSHIKMMHLSDPTYVLVIYSFYLCPYLCPLAGNSVIIKLIIHLNINEWNRLVNWYIIYIENSKIVMAFKHSLGYSNFTK